MRLLELRHRTGTRAQTVLRDATTPFAGDTVIASTPDAPIDDAPRLRLTIAAAPHTDVIAGAVVGVAIDVFNDGAAPAPLAMLVLSLPLEAEFRSGTLRIDGREPGDPEGLFGTGLAIPRLPGGTASKVTFQLLVLPGVGSLFLQPRLDAGGAPVVGAVGISIKRRAGSIAAPPQAERPFYEPDDEEERAVAESETAMLPPVLPPAPPSPVLPTPLAATIRYAEPEAEPETEPARAPEPDPAPANAPGPDVLVAAPSRERRLADAAAGSANADERMIRFRTLGPNDVALLERLFATPAPGIVAHNMLISALTCCESDDAATTAAWRTFLKRDVELLGRILVLSRLGKPLQFAIAQTELAALPMAWSPAPGARSATHRRLRRELRANEFTAMCGLLQPSNRDTNLRLRIALLAVAGATIDGIPRRDADEALVALASYRSAALAWLVPLCVASAGPAFVLAEPPAALDAAGRRLVTVLHAAFSA